MENLNSEIYRLCGNAGMFVDWRSNSPILRFQYRFRSVHDTVHCTVFDSAEKLFDSLMLRYPAI